MFISQAFAQGAAAPGGGDFIVQLAPLVLIFAVFYFLLIRPQQRRMKAQRDMLAAIRRGDRVVTGGGIIGTVVKVDEPKDELTVEISEGVRVKVVRSTVSSVLARTEPAKADREGGSPAAPEPAAAETTATDRKGLARFLRR